MVAAVIFVDGILSVDTAIEYKWLEKINCADCYIRTINAYYGYSDNEYLVDRLSDFITPIVVLTNSLLVYNNSKLKESVDSIRRDYYIVDKYNNVRRLQDCTDKDLRICHNLEKSYINNGFEKLEKVERPVDKIQV